jgi:hypothetical protein
VGEFAWHCIAWHGMACLELGRVSMLFIHEMSMVRKWSGWLLLASG